MKKTPRGLLTFFSLLALMLFISIGGCSSSSTTPTTSSQKTTLDYASVDAFAKQIFEAISARDFSAYLEMTTYPEDMGADGTPLMAAYEMEDETWRKGHEYQFKNLLASIEKEGGLHTLRWVRAGQALGYMKDENEFLGNMYIEITVGAEKKMVLEIESSQASRVRGRRLMTGSDVKIKPWSYYKTQVL